MTRLRPGTQIGPYGIVAAIGEGGMGEVYRARDTRLGRDVAIKVLPASFAADADRRARFEREAQAVAALSHPNILAVHDTGVHDGEIYLVMELLSGETLRDRLKTGALPPRKAVEIGVQIARGLAAAHAKGLVHRDLKPENVIVTEQGVVKILDFGLARAVGTGSGATETVPVVTDPGTVMGTVGYMAPEQVRGQVVDQRADLFALGAVLYETLTGQRAFKRGTPAETMTAILNEDPPDPSTIRSGVSPSIDHIVRHCLEKNPNERFQSARDVAFALESLSGSGASTAVTVAATRRRTWWPYVALAAVPLAAAIGLWAGRRTVAAHDISYDVKTWDRETIYNARFMPDGSVAYSAAHVGMVPELFLLHPDRAAPERLAGPGTHLLSASSKGELAVLTNAKFIEHRFFSGTLARLTPGGSPRGWLEGVREADWSPGGTTLAVIIQAENREHDRLEYPVGTLLYEADGYLSDVRVSHDGQRVAFVEHRYHWDDRGWVKVVDTKKQAATLTEEYTAVEGVAWSPEDTQILYSAAASSTPGLQPFAVPSTGRQPAHFAFHTPGDAIVFDLDQNGHWLMSREEPRWGIIVKRPGETAEQEMSYLNLSTRGELSPNGSQLLFESQNVGEGIEYALMLRNTDGSPPVRLGEGVKLPHALSPDGRWVAAFVASKGQIVLYPTGAGSPVRFTMPADGDFGGWFSDSQHVLVAGSLNGKPLQCYRQAITGSAPEPIEPADADYCLTLPGDQVALHTRSGKMLLYDRPNGSAVPIHEPDVPPIGFDPGGFAIFGTRMDDQSLRVERVNLRTWDKTLITTIPAADRAGLVKLTATSVVGSPGHYGYVYGYARELSTLILVSGVGLH